MNIKKLAAIILIMVKLTLSNAVVMFSYNEYCDFTSSKQNALIFKCITQNLNITAIEQLNISANVGTLKTLLISDKNLENMSQPILVNFTIVMLYLPDNRIRHISEDTFGQIRQLEKLYLYKNEIYSIWAFKFHPSVDSIKLTLSFNSIDRLVNVLPTEMSPLNDLKLDTNGIDQLGDDVFLNLVNLESLDLSYNQISRIGERSFNGLTNLKELIISSNRLKTIDSQAFKWLPALTRLLLARNFLDYIEPDVVAKQDQLEKFDISFNFLTTFSVNNLFKIKNLRLTNNRLAQLGTWWCAFERLTNFDVSYNNIESIDLNDSNMTTSLLIDRLNLSYMKLSLFDLNILRWFSNLNDLNLCFNQIRTLVKPTYRRVDKLVNLELNNNLLDELDTDTFVNYEKLEYLSLSSNFIKSVEAGDFNGLVSLKKLCLDGNRINFIRNNAFERLVKLALLNLSANSLRQLESYTFYGLESLTDLILSQNKIESIGQDQFASLKNVRNLDLSGNYLIYIEPFSFRGLLRLDSLWLTRNYLSSIDDRTFDGSTVVYLDVEFNQLEMIQTDAFANTMVESLNLDHNRLTCASLANVVHTGRVSKVSLVFNLCSDVSVLNRIDAINSSSFRLSSLDLSQNNIRKFEALANGEMGDLETLRLSSNSINELKIRDFEHLVNLTSLDVSNNPLTFVENGFWRYFQFTELYLNASLGELANNGTFDLDEFPESLERLHLSDNRLGSIRLNSRMNKLRTLLMRNIDLKYERDLFDFELVNGLESIDLSDNPIGNHVAFLNQLTQLKELYLRSIGIDSLHELNFSFPFINTIDLSYNKLQVIRESYFSGFGYLNKIDLSFNLITIIEEHSFNSSLHYLDMQSNYLSEFNFYDLDLLAVNLKFNQITRLFKSDSLEKIRLFDFLDFSYNRLNSSNLDTFFEMENNVLHTLLLDHNRIKYIENDSFSELTHLVYLRVSFNDMNYVEDDAFFSLRELLSLDLSSNNLTLVDNDRLFNFLLQLERLNLSHNRIERFSSNLFANLSNLVELDVSHNELKLINDDSFTSLNQLVYLDMSNNRFIQLAEMSLRGLSSIKDVFVSFEQLKNSKQNQLSIQSLVQNKQQLRNINNVSYYKSIYVNYDEDRVDCLLTLQFLRFNLQLKLKSDYDFNLFMFNCHSIDFENL